MFGISILFLCALAGALAAPPEDICKEPCSPENVHHYYKELECKPIKEPGRCCPSRYDCSHLDNRDKSQCYYKGKPIVISDQAKSGGELFPGSCLASCRCNPPSDAGSSATLQCAHVECPTLFNPIPKGCYETSSKPGCCSDGMLCPDDIKPDTVRCNYDNTTYFEGQSMYPPDARCKSCKCMKGFDGTLEGPWCETVTCGLELHYSKKLEEGCAPVFFEGGRCCPIDWRCPETSDVVTATAISKHPAQTADPSATCKWGSLTMSQGDILNTPLNSNDCQTCRCDVPPHVTCEQVNKPCPAETRTSRVARSVDPKDDPCASVRCVRACVKENGKAKCI